MHANEKATGRNWYTADRRPTVGHVGSVVAATRATGSVCHVGSATVWHTLPTI
jgi:hypothetical protein